MYDDALEFYKSLNWEKSEVDYRILTNVLDKSIVPDSFRYNLLTNVKSGTSLARGVVKSLNGEYYYFQEMLNDFKLMKSETEDKEKELKDIFDRSTLGMDIIRKDSMPVTEEQNIATQQQQITNTTPGGTGPMTPDDPNVGRNWHQEEPVNKGFWTKQTLLKGLGQYLQENTPKHYTMDPKEREFLLSTGRTAAEIDGGRVRFSPMLKSQFSLWKSKSLRKSVSTLDKWVKK